MEAIIAEELAKSYGELQALKGVTLAVEPGEIFALVGPNGAGKTTFVRCLTGTTDPDDGVVSLLGDHPRAIDRTRLGLLPQEFSPSDRLTVRELVAYYAGLYDDAREVETVLSEVGLENVATTRYQHLSGGERRRTLVATALINDPSVLFLDEPTTGIDPAGRLALWSIIEDLADGGTTVFVTTHSLDEAERRADRVGVLANGELVAIGSPGELVAAHGGESRLLIETEEAVELEGYNVETLEGGVIVHDIGPDEIDRIVRELHEAEVTFSALEWRQPDLELVYLTLVGERPRSSLPGGSVP